MKTNMTYHARYDRKNRIEYILDTVGLGEPVCEWTYKDERHNGPVTKILTDTGVIILKNNKNKIITTWIGSTQQAKAVYVGASGGKATKMPQKLYTTIKDNQKYVLNQPCA